MFVFSGELARQRKEPAILASSAMCAEMSEAYKAQSRAVMSETWKVAGMLEIKAKAELYLCFCGVPRTQTEASIFVFFNGWTGKGGKKLLYFRKYLPRLEGSPFMIFVSFNHGNLSSQWERSLKHTTKL